MSKSAAAGREQAWSAQAVERSAGLKAEEGDRGLKASRLTAVTAFPDERQHSPPSSDTARRLSEVRPLEWAMWKFHPQLLPLPENTPDLRQVLAGM